MSYVLIPGAGGEAQYWQPVVPTLEAAGQRAVAVDLPADDDAYGLEEYAALVVAAIDEHDLAAGGDLVIVAQSMGAFTAPLVHAQRPARRIDLVCAMIPAAGERPSEWWTNTGEVEAAAEYARQLGRDPDAPFDVMWAFFHDTPPDVLERVLAAGERDQSSTPYEQPFPLDGWPDVPTRVLAAALDRLMPLAFMERLAHERLGVTADVIEAGHLPALSRPRELAEWLLDADR